MSNIHTKTESKSSGKDSYSGSKNQYPNRKEHKISNQKGEKKTIPSQEQTP